LTIDYLIFHIEDDEVNVHVKNIHLSEREMIQTMQNTRTWLWDEQLSISMLIDNKKMNLLDQGK